MYPPKTEYDQFVADRTHLVFVPFEWFEEYRAACKAHTTALRRYGSKWISPDETTAHIKECDALVEEINRIVASNSNRTRSEIKKNPSAVIVYKEHTKGGYGGEYVGTYVLRNPKILQIRGDTTLTGHDYGDGFCGAEEACGMLVKKEGAEDIHEAPPEIRTTPPSANSEDSGEWYGKNSKAYRRYHGTA